MTRKIISGLKDKNGIFISNPPEALPSPAEAVVPDPSAEDLSVDDLMKRGLKLIYRTLKSIDSETCLGAAPSRNSVMNLKDCMAMLHALSLKEKDLLDKMSDEDLERYASKKE